MAGLIKVVLAIEHGEIPPQINFERPSPHIPWDELPVRVVAGRTPWPGSSRRRVAGVSAFGFSGTNAHVIVAAPRPAPEPTPSWPSRSAGASPDAVRAQRRGAGRARRSAWLGAWPTRRRWTCATSPSPPTSAAPASRTGAAIRAATLDEARRAAGGAGRRRGDAPALVKRGVSRPGCPARRVPVHRPGIAVRRRWGASSTTRSRRSAARWIDARELLRPELERPLLSVLFGDAPRRPLDQTAYTQPALFALEHALCRALAVLGRRAGRRARSQRGRVRGGVRGGIDDPRGGMPAGRGARPAHAVASRGRRDGRRVRLRGPGGRRPRRRRGRVSIAAVNGPAHVVISGDGAGGQRGRRRPRSRRHRAQRLIGLARVPLASDGADPRRFAQVAGNGRPGASAADWVSNVTGAAVGAAAEVDAAYWRRHVREPVRFADGMQALWGQGYRVFVEIGPGATLAGMGRAALPAGGRTWLPSLRRGRARLGPDPRDPRRALDARGGRRLGRLRSRSTTPAGRAAELAVRARALLARPARSAPPPTRAADTAAGHPLLGRRLRSALQRRSVRGGDRCRQTSLSRRSPRARGRRAASHGLLRDVSGRGGRARQRAPRRSWTSRSRRPWSCRTAAVARSRSW